MKYLNSQYTQIKVHFIKIDILSPEGRIRTCDSSTLPMRILTLTFLSVHFVLCLSAKWNHIVLVSTSRITFSLERFEFDVSLRDDISYTVEEQLRCNLFTSSYSPGWCYQYIYLERSMYKICNGRCNV